MYQAPIDGHGLRLQQVINGHLHLEVTRAGEVMVEDGRQTISAAPISQSTFGIHSTSSETATEPRPRTVDACPGVEAVGWMTAVAPKAVICGGSPCVIIDAFSDFCGTANPALAISNGLSLAAISAADAAADDQARGVYLSLANELPVEAHRDDPDLSTTRIEKSAENREGSATDRSRRTIVITQADDDVAPRAVRHRWGAVTRLVLQILLPESVALRAGGRSVAGAAR
jgi:hypothetical protein